MPEIGVIDAGTISLLYTKDCQESVVGLFENVKNGEIEGIIPESILAEVYKNLVLQAGRGVDGDVFARGCIINFRRDFPVRVEPCNTMDLIRAGSLKAEYRSILTLNQCLGIALALRTGGTYHTTLSLTSLIQPPLKGLTFKIYGRFQDRT